MLHNNLTRSCAASSLFWTAISYFTMYGELSGAQDDKDFQHVRMRLQNEWLCIGAIVSIYLNVTPVLHSFSMTRLAAYTTCYVSIAQPHSFDNGLKFDCVFHSGLISIDATIFTISPDATLKIRSSAYLAVVISIISSGLGIACVIWFHLRYQWIAIETFIVRTSCACRPSRALISDP